tara:strand:+ start:3650 stop:4330 length:681 start_codon:yes stop_codon:yes gene_type:complete
VIWSDKGFLLSKVNFKENSIIAKFYTEKHGKFSGIIYGATSKKIKSYLQKGNELYLEYHAKNENSMGYFKIEIINPSTSKFFSEKIKLSCIVSILDLVNLLTVEGQQNEKIYNLIKNIFLNLDNKNWIENYIYSELELLRYIGFDLNIKEFCKSEVTNNIKNYFINTSSKKLMVPNFLVENSYNNISKADIYNSLILISEFMKKNIFIPNSLNFPVSRLNFINNFK